MTMGPLFRKYPEFLTAYILLLALILSVSAQDVVIHNTLSRGEVGAKTTLSCMVEPVNADVAWVFQEKPLESSDRIIKRNGTVKHRNQAGDVKEYKIVNVTIVNATSDDAGNYSCVAKLGDGEPKSHPQVLDLGYPAKFVGERNQRFEFNASDHANVKLKCVFEVYKTREVTWWRDGSGEYFTKNATPISLKQVESTYDIHKVGNQHNGTYVCQIWDPVNATNVSGTIDIIVYDKPVLKIDTVIGISMSELFFNWTIEAFNSKVISYNLMYRASNDTSFSQYPEKILPNSTSFVMKNLKKSTEYKIKLEVETYHWNKTSTLDTNHGRTLDKDPIFVPNISINGFSATSVTIGWAPPPDDIAHLIHYYELEARKKDGGVPSKAFHSRDARNLPYMFDNLEPHSTYIFKVCACQEFTKKCGNWSEEMEAATLDGIPGRPANVTVTCTSSQMVLNWSPPVKPNAEIKGYMMELTGVATYRDRTGVLKKVTWGPLSRFMSNDSRTVRFDDLQPNTNYTVRLSAMTRTRRRGEEDVRQCNTSVTPPDLPPRPRWIKILDPKTNRYVFRVDMQKVSERNGPICCYRVYMVRMLSNTGLKDLKSQTMLDTIDYKEAHSAQPSLGAYITDIFTNDNFPKNGLLIMGDENTVYDDKDPGLGGHCSRCKRRRARVRVSTRPVTSPQPVTSLPGAETTTVPSVDSDDADDGVERRRRSINSDDYSNNPIMGDAMRLVEEEGVTVEDGPLDPTANYTMFVELIPSTPQDEPMYSDFMNPLVPAPSPVAPVPSTALEIALQVACAIAALIVVIMLVICVMQTRRSRKLPPRAALEMNPIQAAIYKQHAAVIVVAMLVICVMQTRRSRKLPPRAALEMNPIQAAIYYVLNKRGRQQLVPTTPPDMPPIAKEDLAAAYAERHADSDYGFQKEFELLQLLSECYPDRTTHASEARENQPKNRYPDIKAYDQTRVKLSQIDSITGSDYINANYVMGYKERKKFICAQGPTDTTVNDFWRMVWEHGLELIVMLTNLEEYSKVKCSKYWPDEVRGSRAFGAITVHHVQEKRYSDYIVRELKITKQPTNSEGQPIVENNGVAKRNGDIKEPSESAPTSPRDRETKETEWRTVRQYHFLMWKDFAAPEHPQAILKFIKRVNEAWSNTLAVPAVVHCSAGVGRTGTLVALDVLLEQLRTQGQVAVLSCVAELRRQRNFLVQSQKQYVFVYRALLEYAHYGDTEIPASQLKSAVDRLRNTPEGAAHCLMETEFQKMIDSPIIEPVKSCAAAQAEELRPKNRSMECLPYDRNRVMLAPIPGRDYSTYINASFVEGIYEELRPKNRSMECLPYDRNRVMLAPIPGRDYSTYINASFVEAYDNSEGFIITQDPLPNTIFDFWRMVSEQNISTIVMLSEIGEGKCVRYWDDGTAQYEHMSVQYEESESCPYYIRRQFRLTNNKVGDILLLLLLSHSHTALYKCVRYWDDGTAQYEHMSVQYEESESCPYYIRRQFRLTNNKVGDILLLLLLSHSHTALYKCVRYWDDGTAQYEHMSVQYEESESCPYYIRRQFRLTNNKVGDILLLLLLSHSHTALYKCVRYWDDGTAQYEHMSVQYEESESCPYYIRRQFRLTNNKTGQVQTVRQLQYQGWPTAAGHVPEVTRGLGELADAAAAAAEAMPMLVHCHTGTERSALFVALCILINQLRTERCVDVSAVARKVRSQRQHTIDTFLQYEFLHRAILNYAELHNLLEDS